MRVWAVYKETMHGQPVFPVFMTKYKMEAERYLEWRKGKVGLFEYRYHIVEIDIEIPKVGFSHYHVKPKVKDGWRVIRDSEEEATWEK